jgi:putative flippase GtrA
MAENRITDELIRPFGLLALLCSSPLLFLFIHLGHMDQGIGAWICATLILFSIRARKELMRLAWFWVTLAVLTLIQIPIVWFTPWTAWDLRLVYVVVAILDNALIYGCIYLVEKAMTKKERLGNPS